VHGLEIQIWSEGFCVIFSLKNKTDFATKPSPSARYHIILQLGQREYFCDLYFISGDFITKTRYLFSIKFVVIIL
jgi:hypothetical protein